MGYRDYLEAQKKYIQAKKEALQGKKERLQSPRPRRGDPPPAPVSKWLIAGIITFFLLPLAISILIPVLSPQEAQVLTVGILASKSEFLQIKNWLEPEILANDLAWNIEKLPAQLTLLHNLRMNPVADLLIIEAELAEELYKNHALIGLLDKTENPSFLGSFYPFWETQPFRKTLGIAIPRGANIDEARHLYTVICRFAPAFKPSQPLQP